MLSKENVSFIYSIIIPFWKIAYYLSRVSRAIEIDIDVVVVKKHMPLKFCWKVRKIAVKKLKLILLELSLSNMPEYA